jgi:hypothetical protein
MKIKLPAKPETLDAPITVRFTQSEMRAVRDAAGNANMEIAPFIRLIVNNAVRLGVELAE